MVTSTATGQAIYYRVRAGYIRRGVGMGRGGQGRGGIAFLLSTWKSKINKPWDRGVDIVIYFIRNMKASVFIKKMSRLLGWLQPHLHYPINSVLSNLNAGKKYRLTSIFFIDC